MDNVSLLSSSNPLYSHQKGILASSLLQKEKENEAQLEEEEEEDENLLQGQEEYGDDRGTTDEAEELFIRGEEEEEEEREGIFSPLITSVEHTFLENAVFYLFLGSVPGWLLSFFSYLFLHLFPSSPSSLQEDVRNSKLIGCLCFILSLKLYGILLSRGAITDPCGVFLRLQLLKDLRNKIKKERENGKEQGRGDSRKINAKQLNVNERSEEEKEASSSFFFVFLRLSLASICAAIFVGCLRRLSFSSSSPSSLAFQVYSKETSFLKKHEDVTSLSSPLDLLSPISSSSSSSSSFFLSFYSLLPEFIQMALTSSIRAFLLTLCHILVFLRSLLHLSFVSIVFLGVSVVSLGASIVSAGVSIVSFLGVPILSSSALTAKVESLVPFLSLHEVSHSASVSSFSSALSMLFGGKRGDEGLIDVVKNRFGSISQLVDFEMLLWVNGIARVFLGECIFSCINYMLQGVDFLIAEILSMQAEETEEEEEKKQKKKKREKRVLLISGAADLSLILGAMIYLAGSPYCQETGGPVLNGSYAVMSYTSRLDFFGALLLLLADFAAVYLASHFIRPISVLLKNDKKKKKKKEGATTAIKKNSNRHLPKNLCRLHTGSEEERKKKQKKKQEEEDLGRNRKKEKTGESEEEEALSSLSTLSSFSLSPPFSFFKKRKTKKE